MKTQNVFQGLTPEQAFEQVLDEIEARLVPMQDDADRVLALVQHDPQAYRDEIMALCDQISRKCKHIDHYLYTLHSEAAREVRTAAGSVQDQLRSSLPGVDGYSQVINIYLRQGRPLDKLLEFSRGAIESVQKCYAGTAWLRIQLHKRSRRA